MGVLVYVFCHFLIKLFSVYVLTMMLSLCCVTENIEMSLLFLLFAGAIPLLWILSPIDVTLYFNGLGIFDCISRACWSKSTCGHRTVDVLHRWIIELSIYEHRDHKQATKRNLTPRICIYFATSTWKSLVNPWRALSTHVPKQRPSSLAAKNIWVAVPCDSS